MSGKELKPWKTLSRQVLLDHSKYLKVESHGILLPGGEVIEDWPWVIIPDAVIVLAKTSTGKYLCFRQTKYAVKGTTFAPVAGMVGPGEEPLYAAKRELLEETGYVSEDWLELGSFSVEPNRGVGNVFLYLAQNAEKVSQPDSDDLEEQILLKLSLDELRSALISGEFKVISWAACISLALLHQKSS